MTEKAIKSAGVWRRKHPHSSNNSVIYALEGSPINWLSRVNIGGIVPQFILRTLRGGDVYLSPLGA